MAMRKGTYGSIYNGIAINVPVYYSGASSFVTSLEELEKYGHLESKSTDEWSGAAEKVIKRYNGALKLLGE